MHPWELTFDLYMSLQKKTLGYVLQNARFVVPDKVGWRRRTVLKLAA